MKKKKEINDEVKLFREFLQELAKPKLPTKASKLLAEKETGIAYSSIDVMLYKGQGGMDSWITLLMYLYPLKSQKFNSILTDIKKFFKKKDVYTPAQIRWEKIGNQLSDDKKLFWCDVISMMDDLESNYSIKIKKKK